MCPEHETDDPAVRIIKRLAKIQQAKRLGQKNLVAVMTRQIARLYEVLIPKLRLGK